MTENETKKAEREREAAEAATLGEGNEDWGQFFCDECWNCARREVCFGK